MRSKMGSKQAVCMGGGSSLRVALHLNAPSRPLVPIQRSRISVAITSWLSARSESVDCCFFTPDRALAQTSTHSFCSTPPGSGITR
jgi:hypothetical protein